MRSSQRTTWADSRIGSSTQKPCGAESPQPVFTGDSQRTVPGAREAIDTFTRRRQETRDRIRELGDDPDEIKNWVWSSGEPVPA